MSLCLCAIINWSLLRTSSGLHKYLLKIVTCHLLQYNLSISFLIQSKYLYLEILTTADPVIMKRLCTRHLGDSYTVTCNFIMYVPNYSSTLKSVHFKNTVARFSFFQSCDRFQYKISWCCIENDYNFERNEDRATVFLKRTDFK